MGRTTAPMAPGAANRELIGAAEFAELLGIGLSRLGELRTNGLIPRPLILGDEDVPRSPRTPVRWRVREIRDWVDSGCPPADRWKWAPATLVVAARIAQDLTAEVQRLESEKRRLLRENEEIRLSRR